MSKFYKKLIVGKTKSGGRGNKGNICVRHIGGGSKQKDRLIDFNRKMSLRDGLVLGVYYDPNRTGYVANVCYTNKMLSLILAGDGLLKGDIIVTGSNGDRKISSSSLLKNYGKNDVLHCVEYLKGEGGKLCRAGGTYSVKLNNYGKMVMLRLPSGELRLFDGECSGSYGMVSNSFNIKNKMLKAGDTRHIGKRPKVRGEAMNPVDHPHGGNTRGGTPRVTLWGKVAKGKSTRRKLSLEVLQTKGSKINVMGKRLKRYL